LISDQELARRARALDWLLFDVDGVLTDGRLLYGAGGEELKVFHVRDGLGLKLAQRAGLKVGILSGRGSAALAARARELGLDAVMQERADKGAAFAEFLAAQGTAPERVAYVGDDLLDLPVLRRCALSFAPADAVPEVKARVDRVLASPGGGAAVREMCELILRERGDWEGLVEHWLAAPAS
jgi:3-deoxy-D-manno-octulosonate 8-phosphate phosphatase (KDO 8-P phosphatase)